MSITVRLKSGHRGGHRELHSIERIGWLRASVLGANDGIISTASLVLAVASANASHGSIMLAGVASLTAGAMSMATGEYISVHSQADSEKAALEQESAELAADYSSEQKELTAIYVGRGLSQALAQEVAEKLMAHDALDAHAREELGFSSATAAKPLQAALSSAASFAVGAALPLIVIALAPRDSLVIWVAVTALLCLAFLGGLAAKMGGAKILPGVVRVSSWSALALGITAAVGAAFGAVG